MSDSITIQSFKYPNIPHVQYSGEILEETPQYWFVHCQPNTILTHYINNETYTFETRSLHFFSKYHGYTVSIAVNDDMEPLSMFCNISTPCSMKNGTIQYIDIDMDYVLTKENGWYLKNKDTYLKNSDAYNYPIQLTNFALISLQELENNIANGKFPFNVKNFRSLMTVK